MLLFKLNVDINWRITVYMLSIPVYFDGCFIHLDICFSIQCKKVLFTANLHTVLLFSYVLLIVLSACYGRMYFWTLFFFSEWKFQHVHNSVWLHTISSFNTELSAFLLNFKIPLISWTLQSSLHSLCIVFKSRTATNFYLYECVCSLWLCVCVVL